MSQLRNMAALDDPSLAALIEALVNNRKIDRRTETLDEYDTLSDMPSSLSDGGKQHHYPKPDSPPKDVCVGAANPYAVAEALLGRNLDRRSAASSQVVQDVLQTDYDELFDMKYHSVLYAGLKLNDKQCCAERLQKSDMKILQERDLTTPDLSYVRKLEDLEKIGLKDLMNYTVKAARTQNGMLKLTIEAPGLGRRVTNSDITMSINNLIAPFRLEGGQRWTPPNASWRDVSEYSHQRSSLAGGPFAMPACFKVGHGIHGRKTTMRSFDDPIQGAASNSWFVAALFSVFWSDPSMINRATKVMCHGGESSKDKKFMVRFHDKGGRQNGKTETVEVNYELPVNNSDSELIYCKSSDGVDIWPGLYEKAFAKWVIGDKSSDSSSSERPDLTQLNAGDPIKAMAQINGREPHYFECDKHSACDLLGLVRAHSLNYKTINPMTAFTYATGSHYNGANVVANHAYSVLGYCVLGRKQYVVLRNPWGMTEPEGLTSYDGLLGRLEPEVWSPAVLLDQGGVFALECESFKRAFSHIGVAE